MYFWSENPVRGVSAVAGHVGAGEGSFAEAPAEALDTGFIRTSVALALSDVRKVEPSDGFPSLLAVVRP